MTFPVITAAETLIASEKGAAVWPGVALHVLTED